MGLPVFPMSMTPICLLEVVAHGVSYPSHHIREAKGRGPRMPGVFSDLHLRNAHSERPRRKGEPGRMGERRRSGGLRLCPFLASGLY